MQRRMTHLVYAAGIGLSGLLAASTDAAVIYRENFANGTTGDLGYSEAGWAYAGPNPTSSGAIAGGANDSRHGRPIDLPKINANPSGTEETTELANGFAYTTQNNALLFTTEYSFSPADYSSVSMSVWALSGSANLQYRFAARVGTDWYASSTAFVPPSAGADQFKTSAQQFTLDLFAPSTQWVAFDFSGADGATNLSLDPVSLPAGTINAFGVQFSLGGTKRIDTFEVSAVPVPEPTVAFASLALGGMTLLRRCRTL